MPAWHQLKPNQALRVSSSRFYLKSEHLIKCHGKHLGKKSFGSQCNEFGTWTLTWLIKN